LPQISSISPANNPNNYVIMFSIQSSRVIQLNSNFHAFVGKQTKSAPPKLTARQLSSLHQPLDNNDDGEKTENIVVAQNGNIVRTKKKGGE
jgi:hypothetical protein